MMKAKQNFTIQALVTTIVLNGVLLGALYYLLGDTIQANGQLMPFLAIGTLLTLVLAGALLFLGGRAIDTAVGATAVAPPVSSPPTTKEPPVTVARNVPKVERTPTPTKAAPVPPSLQPAPTAAAIQLLAILQREGRFIDFLQEDLTLYEDEQIGAAVRSIHAGCKSAVETHVKLEPVLKDEEGSTITVAPGFDAQAIRLTGAVAGDPPFQGVVRHRGWRAVKVDLPQLMTNPGTQPVVAAAEVEVGQ